MKHARFLSIVLFVFGPWAYSCGAGIAQQDGCSDINPCREGLACLKDGSCTPAEVFVFSPQDLGLITVGSSWSFELQAEGGIKPYTWSMQSDLSWLQIDTRSGILSGTPDQAVSKAEVTITVVDGSYGAGQNITRTILITVSNCSNGSVQTCFQASQGVCSSGVQICQDSVWTSCEQAAPSESLKHCGPSCDLCDSQKADRCEAGACACGSKPACQEGQACCQGNCFYLLTDISNCGVCGRYCGGLVQNASGVQCHEGVCQYESCRKGFADCDQDRQNGCENVTSMDRCGPACSPCDPLLADHCGDTGCACGLGPACGPDRRCCNGACVDLSNELENCGSCGHDCAVSVVHADGVQCQNGQCQYSKCHSGYLDCDQNVESGCESRRSMDHCGPSCLRCDQSTSDNCREQGCFCGSNPPCSEGQTCCDGSCVDLSEQMHNCGACGHNCLALVQNASGLGCTGGVCSYGSCYNGFFDCDQVADNGCETPLSNENCAACGNNCSVHSTERACVIDNYDGSHHCGCNSAADCGSQEQCCNQRCIPLNSDTACGDCNISCVGDSSGPHCLDPANNVCGCRDRSDCGGKCCNSHACLDTVNCP
jgi:hypothetical protein